MDSPQPGIWWGGICSWDPLEQQDPGPDRGPIPVTGTGVTLVLTGMGKDLELLKGSEEKWSLQPLLWEKENVWISCIKQRLLGV